jgi:ADP-heptose:LPS heptosyltransferase
MVRHPVALARTIAAIRRTHYDLAIDPCETSQSSRFLVTVARPRHALGVARSRAAASQDDAWMKHAPLHMAQWPVHLLRGALQDPHANAGPGYPAMDIRLTPEERQSARQRLGGLTGTADGLHATALVGVFTEATGAKNFGLDWWRRFIDALLAIRPGCAIVEIAPPDGRPRLGGDFPFFSSPSPRKVAAVISNMTGFVSADCGVMHLASASGTPTLGLFSVSDVMKYAPYGNGSQALVTGGKTPEQVAEAASDLIASFVADLGSTRSGQPVRHAHAGGGPR